MFLCVNKVVNSLQSTQLIGYPPFSQSRMAINIKVVLGYSLLNVGGNKMVRGMKELSKGNWYKTIVGIYLGKNIIIEGRINGVWAKCIN